ncbi:hypothetical protein [Psychromonas hadalis]|uniref:hypothetical protein n=1 Tax=Psychromonas hadalis TaxID=211669 RepID=UPI000524806A|nr:hypothetical protein [Psychromonas hadalis]
MQKNIHEFTQVIKIKDRYFCRFGKKSRVMTAHSLTGATTYQEHEVVAVFKKLVDLGKKPVVVTIGEVDDSYQFYGNVEGLHILLLESDLKLIDSFLSQGLTLTDWREHTKDYLKYTKEVVSPAEEQSVNPYQHQGLIRSEVFKFPTDFSVIFKLQRPNCWWDEIPF